MYMYTHQKDEALKNKVLLKWELFIYTKSPVALKSWAQKEKFNKLLNKIHIESHSNSVYQNFCKETRGR